MAQGENPRRLLQEIAAAAARAKAQRDLDAYEEALRQQRETDSQKVAATLEVIADTPATMQGKPERKKPRRAKRSKGNRRGN